MKRFLALCLLLGCWLPLALSATDSQVPTPRGKVIFGDGTVVTVELARTAAQQQRGLMFRQSLAERDGMLFIFDTSDFRPFWMQNCQIALDIIWVDEASTIVSIAESVPPCRMPGCNPPCASNECPQYPPRVGTKAKFVVEVQAGFSKAHKVAVGQKIKIDGV